MKIQKIYFDMDGVLADFNRGVAELCGIEIINQKEKTKAADEYMWSKIKELNHFYDKLELMPGAGEMFRYAYRKYPKKVEILTGIPKPKRGIDTAGEDKKNWVKRLLRDDIPVNIVYREDKKNYATGKDMVLIDDLEENILEWEASGGTGILYKSAEDTKKRLRDIEISLGGNKLLSTPYGGWATIEFNDRLFDLSFISDVAKTWLAQLCEHLESGEEVHLYGDEEGTRFEIIPYDNHLTLIHKGREGKTEYNFSLGIEEFCRLLCDDIKRDIVEWADWECDYSDDDEYLKTQEEILKKQILKLKRLLDCQLQLIRV